MSDEFKPTKEQAKAGWTERSLEAYVNERNAAAGGNIFGGSPLGFLSPRGRPSRPLRIEKGPNPHQWAMGGGYDPRTKHRRLLKMRDEY